MPSYSRKIDIPGKSAKDLFKAISKAIETHSDRIPFGNVKITQNPEDLKISACASMFNAHLTCKDGGIVIEGRMSLLALPLKPKIDGEIDKWVSEAFGQRT